MKLTEIYQNKKTVLSFEIFPPKKEEELKNIDRTLEALCEVQPDFISVTFGAGGSANKNKTIELAKKIKEDYHIEPVVHLTCLCRSVLSGRPSGVGKSYAGIKSFKNKGRCRGRTIAFPALF